MSNGDGNGSWRNILIGLLITLILTSFGFTFIVSDSRESKEDSNKWRNQHEKQHITEVQNLKQTQQDIKETVKESKEDIKDIKKLLMEQKNKGR